jgi:hypothetical protein
LEKSNNSKNFIREILYKNNGNVIIETDIDADYAGPVDGRRSTTKYCSFVGGNLITSRSTK